MRAYLSLIGSRGGGRLFEAGRLVTFSAFRMGANSRLGAYSSKYGMNHHANVSFQQITFKPGNFTNLKALFSVVSTNFP